MRNALHLHERHLHEAVRRKVITSDQMESVLAIARSMSAADGEAAPDLRWVTVIHGAAAAVAVGFPAVYLLSQIDKMRAGEFGVWSAIAAAVALALAYAVRRMGLGKVPSAILTAGGAVFAWGVGAALYDANVSHVFGSYVWQDDSGMTYEARRLLRWKAYLAGDAAVILAGLALWARKRVATVFAPVAFAALHGVMAVGEIDARTRGTYLSDGRASHWLLASAVLMLGLAHVIDRFYKGRADAAFWLHTLGLAPLGVAAALRIDDSAAEGALWTVLTFVVAFIGVKADRKSYLVAAAMALLFFPAFAFSEARAGGELVVASLIVSTGLIAAIATGLRRHYAAKWLESAARGVDRTVWE